VFQNLESNLTQATELCDYRMLWLQLSHLATQTGFAFCYTYGLYLTHLFFVLALSTYATLSDIIVGTFGNNILVTTCVFVSGFMIFAMCECADDVVLKVSADNQLSRDFFLWSGVLRHLELAVLAPRYIIVCKTVLFIT
jgi:hypothetical protein